jgi:hypothetical protein
MRPIAPGALSASRSANPVIPEEPEFIVEPTPTPPLPAETLPVSGPHEMPPHLLLHPVFDKAKASTGVADGKIVHPAAHLIVLVIVFFDQQQSLMLINRSVPAVRILSL